MNAIIEAKLRDLWHESLKQNDLQTHVAIHQILAHKLQGTGGEFVKWMCQFNSDFKMNAAIDGGREVLPGEVPRGTLPNDAPEQGKDWVN